MVGLAAHDVSPVLWVITGAAAVGWFLLFGVCAAITEPRRVDPGARTLDLGGHEPPAVVNLVACDWRLGQESLPATLLDLAARKRLAIDQAGDQTFVRVRTHHNDKAPLTNYEEMVLDHVRRLARESSDGTVPAEALTTGPQDRSAGWWKDYRKAVESDARTRGLARARWSPGVRTLLTGAALPVAILAGITLITLFGRLNEWTEDNEATSASGTQSKGTTATTTTSNNSDDDDDDDNPVMAAIGLAVVSWGGLISLVETAGKRQRDTAQGREAAAKWLGLREMLADNTLFGEQQPAGVAIWDRHIAYGAALGVAHGAVRALPLGAESDTEAWSSVGGRWRVVRIRYPRFVPPGYGRHPFRAFSLGLLQTALFGWILLKVPTFLTHDVLDELRQEDTTWADRSESGLHIAALVIAVVAALIVARAACMTAVGAADLVTGHPPVEGRVLRFRVKGSDKKPLWYMAIDDGSSQKVRACLFHKLQAPNQGHTVRAGISRHLQHVKELSDTADAASSTNAHEMNAPGE